MKSNLLPSDFDRLLSGINLNITKELMVLNREKYQNQLDILSESRRINLERIKFFLSGQPSQAF
ncbi:MAG: hypothetical protein ACOYLH_06425 [Flavobacteriales bacterium]